jgi:hypothetical protein
MFTKRLVALLISAMLFSFVGTAQAESTSVPSHPLKDSDTTLFIGGVSYLKVDGKDKIKVIINIVNRTNRLVSGINNVNLVVENQNGVKVADLHADKFYFYQVNPGEEQQNDTPIFIHPGEMDGNWIIADPLIPLDEIKSLKIRSGSYDGEKSDVYILEKGIHLFYNNSEKKMNPSPVIVDGNTLVPMRAVFEMLDATISWDDQTRSVSAVKGNITVVHKVGTSTMIVNGKEVTLPASSQIIENSTMVPLRAISESLGARVFYGNTDDTIVISIANFR